MSGFKKEFNVLQDVLKSVSVTSVLTKNFQRGKKTTLEFVTAILKFKFHNYFVEQKCLFFLLPPPQL